MEDEQDIPGYGAVSSTLRRWWVNCAQQPDDEIKAIDKLEDGVGPLNDETIHLRELIGTLESCHHKLEHRVGIIIDAIGTGRAEKTKGPMRREPGQVTPREREYEALIQILSSWCSGHSGIADLRVGPYSGTKLLDPLGERTALKTWQVDKVTEKIRRFADPERRWNQAYENVVDTDCEGEAARFRDRTKQTVIHDTENGKPAELTLAQAIDLFTGCNWDYLETLRTILAAIGGRLHVERPIALHDRNVKLRPTRKRMEIVSNTLRAFCEGKAPEACVNPDVLEALKSVTPVKRWLAASLDKTLRLQLGL